MREIIISVDRADGIDTTVVSEVRDGIIYIKEIVQKGKGKENLL